MAEPKSEQQVEQKSSCEVFYDQIQELFPENQRKALKSATNKAENIMTAFEKYWQLEALSKQLDPFLEEYSATMNTVFLEDSEMQTKALEQNIVPFETLKSDVIDFKDSTKNHIINKYSETASLFQDRVNKFKEEEKDLVID